MAEERTSDRVFIGSSVVLFVASAVATTVCCKSMSAMGTMQMPGGWTMSMSWMRMPGQSWTGAAASFTGMWIVMMSAMMLPSLVPMLYRYRSTIERTFDAKLGWLTSIASIGYLLIWTAWGIAVFPLGAVLSNLEMDSPNLARAVPAEIAGIVLVAGIVQFSEWKLRYLACCRQRSGPGRALHGNTSTALRYGLRLGFHCSLGCANLTVILLVAGVMDVRTMVLVTTMITAERIAPNGERAAKTIGIGVIGMGLFLAARAFSLV